MRSFKIYNVTSIRGCESKFHIESAFTGKNPGQAAKKALNHICRVKRIKGRCVFVITLRDTKTGKLFTYKGTRERKNQTHVRGGREIHFKYKSTVRKTTPIMRSKTLPWEIKWSNEKISCRDARHLSSACTKQMHWNC